MDQFRYFGVVVQENILEFNFVFKLLKIRTHHCTQSQKAIYVDLLFKHAIKFELYTENKH